MQRIYAFPSSLHRHRGMLRAHAAPLCQPDAQGQRDAPSLVIARGRVSPRKVGLAEGAAGRLSSVIGGGSRATIGKTLLEINP